MITLSLVFSTYERVVPSIKTYCGAPEYVIVTGGASAGLIVVLVGICAIITASAASCVPGTQLSTPPAGLFGGMFKKPAGKSGVAKVQGPFNPGALNHLPAAR